MGNMGHQSLGNTTSISFVHHLRDMWKSPRGTVLRIEALALVAIALSFFLAAFGSCRRWSNSWFIQKGFLAANAAFLSLGTYSIGLMQSSPVKSEMYPIWAVSLLALLCCVDSAAASGLDNRSQLWKMLYQLCLYFGYVLLMSISTISSDIGNIAICVLSALTFIKGFHRSMALVLPSSMRNMIREIQDNAGKVSFDGHSDKERYLLVDMNLDIMTEGGRAQVVMDDIPYRLKDVCLSFSLSHLLHRRFLGLSSIVEPTGTDDTWPLVSREDYERAFMVVETELAFLYDVLYTSNPFLHYYEAKSASIWAFASVIGICFVGAVAVIPGARTNRRASPGTIVVDATTADFVITGVILVSLALLQVLQLLRCWTSNWARVSLACDWVRKRYYEDKNESIINWFGLYLRLSLVKIDWFDKYLWQNKLGQHSLIESTGVLPGHNLGLLWGLLGSMGSCKIIQKCYGLLGLQYIGRVLQELLQGSNTEVPVELDADVKSSIGDFVGKITCDEVCGWASSSVENGRSGLVEYDPWVQSCRGWFEGSTDDEIYVSCILMWHIATCYCQLAQQHDDDDDSAAVQKDRRVATTLSKYCAYLVVSAPRLLPGRSETIKRVSAEAIEIGKRLPMDKMLAMETNFDVDTVFLSVKEYVKHDLFRLKSFFSYVDGVKLGKGLQSKPAADRWKVMAEFWVKALVYAAPSDKAEEHLQHLSQGGELITHLWALLYHIGIQRWQLNNDPPLQPVTMGWDYIFRIRSWQDYYSTTECR